MIFLIHLLVGLIIGKISGQYAIAIIGAVFLDLDHLICYSRNGVLLRPKKLWRLLTTSKDPYGSQRNFLHSFFAWASISLIGILINFEIGLIFSTAYLTHLLIDMLDDADYYPFYPFKINVKGIIKYFSKSEVLIIILLSVLFFLI